MSKQPYTIETYDNERDWLEARQLGIGSSEAASVSGLGRDRGQYAVWADKTSPVVIEEKDDIVLFGHLHEPTIAAEFFRRAKLKGDVLDPGEFSLFRRTDFPHHICTPDRLLIALGPGIPYAVLELKTAYYDQAKIWQKRVPLPYMAQIQWQMHVIGVDQAFIAVLCNGYQFRWHPVKRHQRLIDRMVDKVDRFWRDHVEANVAPAPDATEAMSRSLARMYATPEPTIAELSAECDGMGTRYDKLNSLIKKIEAEKLAIKNRVQSEMQCAEYGLLVDGSGFQWSGKNGKRRFTRKKKVSVPDG